MNETTTYNETIIVATLVIATNYFFSLLYVPIFLQRKRLLYTTEHIRGDIDGLLQP